ncbi:MAG: hypothetical protein COB02_12665 [Candidatus Cloacimonadota bacterium]|nr:MAG: hypothetical protein COB02_12665 [Candidatus Cloacimonadota bacterium]
MDEIRLIRFSQRDMDLMVEAKGLESFQIINFENFEECLEHKIEQKSKHIFILFEFFNEDFEMLRKSIKMQVNEQQKLNFCYLFSYGNLEVAKNLQKRGLINFYLQKPYSHYLLISSLLAIYYNKKPLSHVLEEVLELSLDNGCEDIAEYMAQFRRKLFTNF